MSKKYSIGISPEPLHNRAVILHCKPSEIPAGINHDLVYKCGSHIQFLDGPNNRVYYEAPRGTADQVIDKIQKYLDACGWEKLENPSN